MKHDITKIIEQARISKITPGAVVGWIKDNKVQLVASGNIKYDIKSPKVTTKTIYDLASITKTIPLSSLVHLAIQEGKLELNTKAKIIIPELKGKYHELITIKHLLTYTAIWDIPNGLSSYASQGPEAVLHAITNFPLISQPGSKYFYTNAPAVLLSLIVEKIYRKPLDKLASEKIFIPLEMKNTTFDVSEYPDEIIAPSEKITNGEIHKIVHDEAARVLRQINFISGNAGLFSSAEDLLIFCSMLLNNGKTPLGKQIFTEKTLKSFETNYLDLIKQSTALGWELNQPAYMGKNSNQRMYGKTGYTGCVIMIDNVKKIAMVVLTNAQYPNRHLNRNAINEFRRNLADIIFQ